MDIKNNINCKTKRYSIGFTLTELIIVIVIIGILAAVLIPSLTRYIDSARDAAAKQEAAPYVTALSTYNLEYRAGAFTGSFEEYCDDLGLNTDLIIGINEIEQTTSSPVSMVIDASSNSGFNVDGFILWAKYNRLVAYNHLTGGTDVVNLNKAPLVFTDNDGNGSTKAINSKEAFQEFKSVLESSGAISINLDSLGSGKIITKESVIVEFTYVEDPTLGLTITAMSGQIKNVVIPNDVKRIGKEVFLNNKVVENITIPSSINRIESDAFKGCINLKKVIITDVKNWCEINFDGTNSNPLTNLNANLYINGELAKDLVIPNDVTIIKSYAFNEFKGLESIKFEASQINFGLQVFSGCENLNKVYIPDLNNWLSNQYPAASSSPMFNGAEVYCNNSLVTSVEVKDNDILPFAFYGWSSLTSVTINADKFNDFTYNNGNTPIAKSGYFGKCDNLISVTVEQSILTDIYQGMFEGCTSLETINLTDSGVTSIRTAAFAGCTKLSTVTLPDNLQIISSSAFYKCEKLNGIIIPSTVTTIGSSAFEGSGLEEISLKDTQVTVISDYLFANSENLKEVMLDEDITNVATTAFEGCVNLEEINVGAGSENYLGHPCETEQFYSISGVLYYYSQDIEWEVWCTTLYIFPMNNKTQTSTGGITLDSSVRIIGKNAFAGNENLTQIEVETTVSVKIMDYAFEGCTSLLSVEFGGSKIFVGSYAFKGCKNLSSFTVAAAEWDDEKITLNQGSFDGCTSLNEITVNPTGGNIYIDINGDPFTGGCPCQIPGMEIINGMKIVDNVVVEFLDKKYVGKVVIPNTVTEIGASAFAGCINITEIIFESGIQLMKIGSSAFNGCISLKYIIIPETVTEIGSGAFIFCNNLEVIYMLGTPVNIYSGAFQNPSTNTLYTAASCAQGGWQNDANGQWDNSISNIIYNCVFASNNEDSGYLDVYVERIPEVTDVTSLNNPIRKDYIFTMWAESNPADSGTSYKWESSWKEWDIEDSEILINSTIVEKNSNLVLYSAESYYFEFKYKNSNNEYVTTDLTELFSTEDKFTISGDDYSYLDVILTIEWDAAASKYRIIFNNDLDDFGFTSTNSLQATIIIYIAELDEFITFTVTIYQGNKPA